MKQSRINLSDMLFWVSPHRINYCTPSSQYTDLNQHESDKNHPHAFYDRGYFYESFRKGQIVSGDWDRGTLEFSKLLEYQALFEHIKGIKQWRHSAFANRVKEYYIMKSAQVLAYRLQDFENTDEFLAARENQIDLLIRGIEDNGVLPIGGKSCETSNLDDISVNLARTGDLLFNNKGHHRLAIAKILNLELIPVQIIVWHSDIMKTD